MIPLTVDVPMKRPPWANWGLILATVIISLAIPYSAGERFDLSLGDDHDDSRLVLQRPISPSTNRSRPCSSTPG